MKKKVTHFKTGDLFSIKDCLLSGLKSFFVYRFVCAGCQFCYIGEIKHHSLTRINKQLEINNKEPYFRTLIRKLIFPKLS